MSMTQTGTGPKVASWLIFTTWVGASAVANYAHGDNTAASLLMASAPVGFAATTGLLEMLVAKGIKIGKSAIAAMVMVATVAGVASYIGLVGLATDNHVEGIAPYLLPIGFDGVVLAASLAIRSLGQTGVAKDVDVDSLLAKHQVTMWPVATRVDIVATESVATEDMDVDSLLAKHGLPSDADMAKAMDMLVDEVATVELAKPRPVAKSLAEAWSTEQAMEYWLAGMASGGWKVADLDAFLGAHYGISGRTFRRRREEIGLRPASAPPVS